MCVFLFAVRLWHSQCVVPDDELGVVKGSQSVVVMFETEVKVGGITLLIYYQTAVLDRGLCTASCHQQI